MSKSDKLELKGVMSEGYGIIPKKVMKDKGLTIEAKSIYAFIASYSGNGNSAYPTVEYITEFLGISRQRFNKHRKLLEDKGYISVSQERQQGSQFNHNVYTIEFIPSLRFATTENPTTENPTTENITTNNNTSNNNTINNNTSHNKTVENVLFEKWWKLYPKKTGSKKKILPKFKKAIKEVGEDQFFKATELYLKTQDEVRFICGPEVFINQERYSKDAMETNKQIIQENNRKQMSNYKNNHYEGYDINKQQLQEAEAKRQKDVEEGYMPF